MKVMELTIETLGDGIRVARANRRIKQAELALAVGVSRPTLSAWEAGERYPDIPQMRRLVEALEAPELWRIAEQDDELDRGERMSTCIDVVADQTLAMTA
jgi:transcriptional regulator with XRE-family HTH domain